MQAVIIGASGGIGSALVDQLASRNGVIVHALSRQGKSDARGAIIAHAIDLTDEDSIQAASRSVDSKSNGAPIDLVIIASGILSDGDDLVPEKSYRQQSAAAFEYAFRINTIGPALVAKHFIPLMPRKGHAVFAALSARVGSISDNRIGGWHAYRASKAALNMLIRNYAIEQSRRSEQFICVGLHPGTVDTELSAPFQNGLPEGQVVTPAQAATNLLAVIDRLKSEDTGKVIDWAGKSIPS